MRFRDAGAEETTWCIPRQLTGTSFSGIESLSGSQFMRVLEEGINGKVFIGEWPHWSHNSNAHYISNDLVARYICGNSMLLIIELLHIPRFGHFESPFSADSEWRVGI